MRAALGDGYVEALRSTWPEVPESADYVMYWWHHAAALVNAGEAERFGFITTNSLKQTFNRRVVQQALDRRPPPRLRHPRPPVGRQRRRRRRAHRHDRRHAPRKTAMAGC